MNTSDSLLYKRRVLIIATAENVFQDPSILVTSPSIIDPISSTFVMCLFFHISHFKCSGLFYAALRPLMTLWD